MQQHFTLPVRTPARNKDRRLHGLLRGKPKLTPDSVIPHGKAPESVAREVLSTINLEPSTPFLPEALNAQLSTTSLTRKRAGAHEDTRSENSSDLDWLF
jgi:hypothetical protein